MFGEKEPIKSPTNEWTSIFQSRASLALKKLSFKNVRIEIMKDEDKFSGKSRLNILAAGLFLAAFCVPVFIIASVDRSAFPEFNGDKVVAAAWVVTCLILSVACAMGARIRERLARLESLAGLPNSRESEQMHPEVQSEGAPSD